MPLALMFLKMLPDNSTFDVVSEAKAFNEKIDKSATNKDL
jgi:hypothetical protein